MAPAQPKSAEYRFLVGRLRMRHFEFLRRLGEEPNLGRVARQMNMAQPTASKLLREIEDILGAPLFIRNRRGMTPTPEGLALARRAGIIIADLRAAHDEFVSVQNGGVGRIRIGVFPVAVPHLLTGFVSELNARWPGISTSIEEGDERSLPRLLSDGKLDCVLGRVVSEVLPADLKYTVLYHEPSAVVASLNHPVIAARASQRDTLMAQAEWLLPHPGGGSYKMIAAKLAQSGLPAPRVAIESISVFVTMEMLRHRPMLSILPHSVALEYAKAKKVAILPIDLLANVYPVGLIYRREHETETMTQDLIAMAQRVAANLHTGNKKA